MASVILLVLLAIFIFVIAITGIRIISPDQ